MKLITDERAWAGSDESLQAVLDAQVAVSARMASGAWDDDDNDDDNPRLLQVHEGIGIVSIKGSLINSDSPWNALFGVVGYGEVRDALISAANNPDIREIVLDVDSGGGSVSGLSDTASLIRTVNDRVKPVTAFTSGSMYSAAYWLGSSAGRVYADQMAGVGSIGIIAVHKEQSKRLADEGIGVSVIRAGKYKALANPHEPLSADGRQQIQAQVDAAYTVFVSHVAKMRGRSYDYTDQTLAQGREFTGQDAVNVGLTDGVKTFDALMSELSAKLIDSSGNFIDNRRNAGGGNHASLAADAQNGDTEMRKTKKALTEQDIAAIAAGAPLAAQGDAEVDGAQPEGVVADVTEQSETAAADTGVEAQAQTAGDAPAAAVAGSQEVAKNDEALRLLKEQLKASQDDLLEAKIAGRKATDRVTELEAVLAPMSEIVGKSINNMRVACNAGVMSIVGMAPEALVAEHARMQDQFLSQYKAGGVAAVDAASGAKKNEHKVDAMAQARLNAVRFSK